MSHRVVGCEETPGVVGWVADAVAGGEGDGAACSLPRKPPRLCSLHEVALSASGLRESFSYAGLLDRAERLFLELLNTRGRIFEQSSRYLVELYSFVVSYSKHQ
mgnify:CR=1 FL=1